MPHRGQILEKYIRSKDVNLTKLAKDSLPWTVKTVYRHFETPNLDLEKLKIYSKALKHDFSEDIPEMMAFKFEVTEPEIDYQFQPGKGVTEAEYYRRKYEYILEKYTELQNKYIEVLTKKDMSA